MNAIIGKIKNQYYNRILVNTTQVKASEQKNKNENNKNEQLTLAKTKSCTQFDNIPGWDITLKGCIHYCRLQKNCENRLHVCG